MDPSETLRNALTDAARLAVQARACASAEGSKASIRTSEVTRKARQRFAEAAEARALADMAKRFVWIPFVRGKTIRHALERARECAEESEKLEFLARRLSARRSSLSAAAETASRSVARLDKAIAAAASLGVPPKAVEDRAIVLWGQSRFLLIGRRNPEWLDRACTVAEEHVEMVKDWATHRQRVMSEQNKERRAATSAVGSGPARKIYLPIPLAMGREALTLGASRDASAPPGTSPFFVRTDQDLRAFGDLLPLAYRGKPPALSFPPIPMRAAGQNLWGVFERDTWNRVRKVNYGMTGHRCAICGGRGGFIADKVLGPEEKRFGVDCHEVWSWDAPDKDTGVGIQKLQRLLVVCPSCHSTFHSGHFISLASEKGMREEVTEFIEKRRMLINGVDAETLIEQLDDARAQLNDVRSVDKWILDLETLGQQQYMLDHGAVMMERNSAGVPPERIAGLAFKTDAGDRFEARSSQDIYREIALRNTSDNVVRLKR